MGCHGRPAPGGLPLSLAAQRARRWQRSGYTRREGAGRRV